jgi:hypothetical protein
VTGVCSKDKYYLYCLDSFYGPILSMGEQLDEEFYVSVLNPSSFADMKYSYFSESLTGYAFGLMEKSRLEIRNERSSRHDSKCVQDSQRMLVNLGTKIDMVNVTDTGFMVRYTQGDICFHASREFFETEVDFICDKTQGDSFPFLVNE